MANVDDSGPQLPAGMPSHASPKSVFSRALRWLTAIASLVGAFAVGVIFNLTELLVGAHEAFFLFMCGGLVVALVLLAALAILQRRAKARLRESAETGLGHFRQLAEALVAKRSESRPQPDLPDLTRQAFNTVPQLITAWLVGRAYWRLFIGFGSVIGAAVLVAQFTVLVEQSGRLHEQNNLIKREGKLASLADHADLEAEQARRAYDEITRILEESTSPSAVVYALERLPEAMLMPVTIADPDATIDPTNEQLPTQTVYPNLVSLAERLLIFAKNARTGPGTVWSEEETLMVSTSIFMALHRLGYDNVQDIETYYGQSVWDCIYSYDDGKRIADPGQALEKNLGQGKGLASALTVAGLLEGGEQPPVDLRHLHPLQLLGADLRGAILDDARLDGIFLARVKLQGAELWGAQLEEADFSDSQLHVTEFPWAQLYYANFSGAQLQGADFSNAQLQGANFSGAELQAVNFNGAQLQGADFSSAQLQDANFTNAQLHGAILVDADLSGARLVDAQLNAGHFAFGITSEYGLAWLERVDHINTDQKLISLRLFGADLFGITIKQYTLDWKGMSLEEIKQYFNLFANAGFTNLSWSTRGEAEAQLRERFNGKADALVDRVVQVKAQLRGVDLTGVRIDQGALGRITPEACSPSADVVFADAVVLRRRDFEHTPQISVPDSYALLEWIRDPSKRPDMAEDEEETFRRDAPEIDASRE